jgi:transposase
VVRSQYEQTLTILSARVDDIPLLLAQVARMGVQPLLDTHCPTHGNWQGLSLGWVTAIWVTHIVSQADHRLNHVEPWAEKRLHTLRGCTGQPLHPLDVSDDRLALVLPALSDDAHWSPFASALTQPLIRVYAPAARARTPGPYHRQWLRGGDARGLVPVGA